MYHAAMPPRLIDRGGVRHELIRELAAADVPRTALAEKYGVQPPAITEFAKRYEYQIQEARKHLDDEFFGLWIAKKSSRLAEYQRMFEEAEEHQDWAEARRVMALTLKSAAEELGQIPNKATIQHEGQVRYVIEGVDTENLK
jgi:hypothetical protein